VGGRCRVAALPPTMYLLEVSIFLGAIALEYLIETLIFKKSVTRLPVGFAIAAAAIMFVRRRLQRVPPLVFAAFAAAIITVFECAAGQFGRARIHDGKQTWNYGSTDCGGYIDWKVSFMWFVLVLILILIIDVAGG